MTVSSVARQSVALLLALGSVANADTFYKIDTDDEIRESARTLAYDTMLYYHGNETGQTPGILPGPHLAVTTTGGREVLSGERCLTTGI
ncbi:unnamed protein product [Parascedosporium putredinis]|uniref:Uncharacterized protein n=1 Tax=Parascedosporium putredinis TaxID=1442378 RepID=A0A9P1H2A4_9PEZI|nr:unnamed protein product [Parascedosporium putredinis]CAI7995929.1 unnamed protein product [Parascedosporium putredinis]